MGHLGLLEPRDQEYSRGVTISEETVTTRQGCCYTTGVGEICSRLGHPFAALGTRSVNRKNAAVVAMTSTLSRAQTSGNRGLGRITSKPPRTVEKLA